jgi:hypothetical protein
LLDVWVCIEGWWNGRGGGRNVGVGSGGQDEKGKGSQLERYTKCQERKWKHNMCLKRREQNVVCEGEGREREEGSS